MSETSRNACFLRVEARGEDPESLIWSGTLASLYLRWSERMHFSKKIHHIKESSSGEVEECWIEIQGPDVCKRLEGETGIHRLIRTSPFDPFNRRVSSFASVAVLPKAEGGPLGFFKDGDITIESHHFTNASGPRVIRSSCEVRVTHLPSGLTIASSLDNSQHRNRTSALSMLQALRLDHALHSRNDQDPKAHYERKLRTYTLDPYRMVVDHLTGCETKDVHSVLGGDLSCFQRVAA